MTAIYTSATAIFSLITQDIGDCSQTGLQEGMRVIVTFAGGAAALACIIGNAGKFRNVFGAKAWGEAENFWAIKEEIKTQIDTTEGLLVKRGLITQDDVEHRRASVERRATTASDTSSTG